MAELSQAGNGSCQPVLHLAPQLSLLQPGFINVGHARPCLSLTDERDAVQRHWVHNLMQLCVRVIISANQDPLTY